MRYYFAPMEGITGYIHRNLHAQLFGHIDKYFTAFIAPNQYGRMSSREIADILPANNQGMYTVPQMLTNSSRDFLVTQKRLGGMGYREINLNLGCPSKTVVNKYRGAGFLAKPDMLNQFLEEIFQKTEMKISIKTRLGMEDPKEFYQLMEIYNQYPLKELIIHPRTQKDFYKNTPNLEVFKEALHRSRHKICYNGDLFSKKDIVEFQQTFPQVETLMIGRGLLRNPGLVQSIETQEAVGKERIKEFHDQIFQGYQEVLSGEKPVLFKMKELWTYMLDMFEESKKHGKKIKKAEHFDGYEAAVEALFSQCEMKG